MNRLGAMVAEMFRFDRAPGPSEWCEKNLTLPRVMSPNGHGPFSLHSRPWARPILDQWHAESGTRKVDVAIAVQMAKTTTMCAGICYRMVHGPAPTMVVGGMSADFAKREISEKRLHPLINASDPLRMLKPSNPDRFKLTSMEMAYAPILVTGAGSDTNLAGSTQGIVCIDEAAKIEHQDSSDAPEAHPIRLAEDRTKDYLGTEFIWKSSTPNSPHHIFWKDVQSGTFTHFYVPCPHCGEYFPFEFESRKNGERQTGGETAQTADQASPDAVYRSVVWSPDARNADGTWDEGKVRDTAHYVCPHCGGPIRDGDKPRMLQAFEEKDHNPRADRSHRSYRVPGFYSPRRTFADMALGFLRRGDLFNTGLQIYYNHELALPWEEVDVRIKDDEVWDCRATGDIAYTRGTVPKQPGLLFAGADWGQNQTHWVVGMIDRQENIWVIDWGTTLALGDLLKLKAQWQYARAEKPETKISPTFGFCDSGDHTEEVYKMCARSGGFWWPSKGSHAESGVINRTQLKLFPTLSLYTYVDKVAKDDLYDRRIHRKQGSRLFLPADVDADFVLGLCGQQRLDKGVRSQWKKVTHDHYGDCVKLLVAMNWNLTAGSKVPENF